MSRWRGEDNPALQLARAACPVQPSGDAPLWAWPRPYGLMGRAPNGSFEAWAPLTCASRGLTWQWSEFAVYFEEASDMALENLEETGLFDRPSANRWNSCSPARCPRR